MTSKHFVPWCPKCNSRNVSEYVNGMPDSIYYEKLEQQGFKFIYNGCVLDGMDRTFIANHATAITHGKIGTPRGDPKA